MVIRLLVVCLVFLAAVVFAFGTAMVILDYEEKKSKSEEEAEESYQVAISMCLKTRHAGSCPGVCEKCAWGVMQNKIVEFREKK